MSHLDLNLVRVFVAIHETRSVTQAAERLDVTQPTISYGLAKLRKVYADRLFTRGTGGLVPTALADQLFTMLMVMAIATTVMTTPMLGWCLRRRAAEEAAATPQT